MKQKINNLKKTTFYFFCYCLFQTIKYLKESKEEFKEFRFIAKVAYLGIIASFLFFAPIGALLFEFPDSWLVNQSWQIWKATALMSLIFFNVVYLGTGAREIGWLNSPKSKIRKFFDKLLIAGFWLFLFIIL